MFESEEPTRGMKAYALDQWELVARRFSDVRLLDEIAQARELLATRLMGSSAVPEIFRVSSRSIDNKEGAAVDRGAPDDCTVRSPDLGTQPASLGDALLTLTLVRGCTARSLSYHLRAFNVA